MSVQTTPGREEPHWRPWQVALQRFFDRSATDLTIGGLIVVSVALTLLELSLPDESLRAILIEVNYGVTCVFALELLLRFAAHPRWSFGQEYFLDIIAVLPLFRPLRALRVIRLLRLLRILRLMGIFSRHASSFPYVFRRGAIEFAMVLGLIMLTVLFATGAVLTIETDNEDVNTFSEALWFSIYTMVAGEPIPSPPKTTAGHVLAVGVMFMGMTVFAMFTGTISAFMVDRLRLEGRPVQWEEFSDHVVICGWNRKSEIIVREYQVANSHRPVPIVVIDQCDGPVEFQDESLRNKVQFLNDDFTKVSALTMAGITRAKTCIIVSDANGKRSAQDADARTILAALTAERLNPAVYTCAELINAEHGAHLDMGRVNDYVVSGEHSGFLLAHAALNRGLIGIFNELLTHERGSQFYSVDVPDKWIGRDVMDLFVHLKREHNAILVAVHDGETDRYNVNPDRYDFQGGEHVIVISAEPIESV